MVHHAESGESSVAPVSKEGRHWLRNVGMASAPQFLAFQVVMFCAVGAVVVWRLDATVQKQLDQSSRLASEQREDSRRLLDETARERQARDAAAGSRELRVLDLGNRTLTALQDNAQVIRSVNAALDRQADDSKRGREMLAEHNEEMKKLRAAIEKLAKCLDHWPSRGGS